MKARGCVRVGGAGAAAVLGGVALSLYCASALAPCLSDVQVSAVACGALPSKGGVAVAVTVGGASLLFVNAHLPAGSAGAQQAARRNAGAERILARLDLVPALAGIEARLRAGSAATDIDAAAAAASSATRSLSSSTDSDGEDGDADAGVRRWLSARPFAERRHSAVAAAGAGVGVVVPRPRRLSAADGLSPAVLATAPAFAAGALRFDRTFFFGDLNYRLAGVTRAQADAALAADCTAALLAADELGRERRAGRGLAGFSEGAIAFGPTYKLDVGSDAFDSSDKRRVPAWTDRVLWRAAATAPPDAVALLAYTSLPGAPRASDHVPVLAVFDVALRSAQAADGDDTLPPSPQMSAPTTDDLVAPEQGARATRAPEHRAAAPPSLPRMLLAALARLCCAWRRTAVVAPLEEA